MDTTKKRRSHEKILQEFEHGKADILVGTQMISKGLDFPNVTLVGVISADTSLSLPDFRAAEKTFSLLTQVAGRSGRGEKEGRVSGSAKKLADVISSNNKDGVCVLGPCPYFIPKI